MCFLLMSFNGYFLLDNMHGLLIFNLTIATLLQKMSDYVKLVVLMSAEIFLYPQIFVFNSVRGYANNVKSPFGPSLDRVSQVLLLELK